MPKEQPPDEISSFETANAMQDLKTGFGKRPLTVRRQKRPAKKSPSGEVTQRILIVAIVGLMVLGIVVHLLTKDDVVFTTMSPMFGGVIGYHFHRSKSQE